MYYNGRLYTFKDGGLVFCRVAETGALLYSERLGTPGYYYASPVAADQKRNNSIESHQSVSKSVQVTFGPHIDIPAD